MMQHPILDTIVISFVFLATINLVSRWMMPLDDDFKWIKDMRHGRAVMPFGKWKGVRIRLIPDDYLSWLTTSDVVKDAKWKWLKDSLMAELRFRGLRDDLASTSEPEPVKQPLPLVTMGSTRRNIILEDS
jgi:uncharacterized protein (DUF3820 family)